MEYTLTLSQTNAGGYVALCNCGWIGNVHAAPVRGDDPAKKPRRDYARAAQDASADWRRHHKLVHVALLKPDPDRAREVVTHRGRYGHP